MGMRNLTQRPQTRYHAGLLGSLCWVIDSGKLIEPMEKWIDVKIYLLNGKRVLTKKW